MDDSQIIQEAYADILRKHVCFFYDSVLTDPQHTPQHEQRFIAGIKNARYVRDRAQTLLAGPLP